MTVTQLKFSDDIFLGTLFDGELIKNNEDKWIYLINDIAYYKGKNIVTKTFEERENIINHILSNEHEYNIDTETLYISKKMYFEYKYIKSLTENYVNYLNYKSSGLYFKNTSNFSDNYLFIFPECRSDSKILNNCVSIEEKDDKHDLYGNVEIIEPIKNNINNLKLEKTTCRFLITTTMLPDIYELYCKNTNNTIEKHSYASVPDIDTSNLLKNIFDDNYDLNENINVKFENNTAIFVECNYHKMFKKWIPFKKVDSMDNINTINQIQIILDSL